MYVIFSLKIFALPAEMASMLDGIIHWTSMLVRDDPHSVSEVLESIYLNSIFPTF